MGRLGVSVSILLWAASLSAQPIPIHPECPAPAHGQVYADPTTWVWADSDAWYNRLVNGVSLVNGMTDLDNPGHVHARYGLPECGMVAGGLLTIPFEWFLHHTDGMITADQAVTNDFPGSIVSYRVLTTAALRAKYGATVAKWPDSTQDGPFPLLGNPMALELKVGEVTIDLSHAGLVPVHGWHEFPLCVSVTYRDPRLTGTHKICGQLPLYSIIDPTAPEGTGAALPISGDHHDTNAAFGFGTYQAMQTAAIPIDSVSADRPITLWGAGYDYPDVAQGSVSGFTDAREDANFHIGNPGTVLQQTGVAPSETVVQFPYPTATTTLGTHTIIFRWVTVSADGQTKLTTNFTMPVTVVAPGGPVPPPPPPVETFIWQVTGVVGAFAVEQEVGSIQGPLQQFRMRDTSNGQITNQIQ